MKPVVLAGGTGSRLWPKSRAALPKHFLAPTQTQSVFEGGVRKFLVLYYVYGY
jgi:mannose-1-phosphate guanylyltransferase